MYGKLIWNPIAVLEMLLNTHYNAGTRAGCFFAGLGFFASQISVWSIAARENLKLTQFR
jgi:NCS1 family nucleobase:cation symporter-1